MNPQPLINLPKLKLVKFDFDSLPIEFHSQYPFARHDVFVMLGEVDRMEGHCVVAHFKTGQIFVNYHTDNFVELPDEEL